MPYRLVVFDDDANQAQYMLEKVVALPCSGEFIAQAVSNLLELRTLLLENAIDILLMDICIDDSPLNGIEFLKRFSPMQSSLQTIFVTGYDTYHSSVYRVSHVWFLLKPVKQEELEEAIEAALANLAVQTDRAFIIKTSSGERAIRPKALRFVESRRRTLFLHVGSQTISANGKLSDLMAQLPSYFVQCHKSFAANMGYIEEIGKDELVLSTGEHVPISQRRRAYVRSTYLAFVGRARSGGRFEKDVPRG